MRLTHALDHRCAARVLRRYLRASSARILIDRDATNKARQSAFKECIVAEFDSSFPLYRIFDGEELSRVLRSGKFTGGTYAVKAERAHGASWGASITEVISVGNNQLRGKRYGDDLFLAKLDPIGMTFFHLDPNVPFDPDGPPIQEASMQTSVCNFQLGASVLASLHDVDLFVVHSNHQMEPLSLDEAKAYAAKRPAKDVDLRPVHGGLLQGSILGVDVRVIQDHGQWSVVLNDDRILVSGAQTKDEAIQLAEQSIRANPQNPKTVDPTAVTVLGVDLSVSKNGTRWIVVTQDNRTIVSDAPTKEDAIELAKLSILTSPSRPIPMPFAVLQDKRKYDKHFEPDADPKKVRGQFGLKPRDHVEVTKGAPALKINARERGVVADVWQEQGDRAVHVKLLFGKRPFTFYATHPNRLQDDEIALLHSMAGRRILVRKR